MKLHSAISSGWVIMYACILLSISGNDEPTLSLDLDTPSAPSISPRNSNGVVRDSAVNLFEYSIKVLKLPE